MKTANQKEAWPLLCVLTQRDVCLRSNRGRDSRGVGSAEVSPPCRACGNGARLSPLFYCLAQTQSKHATFRTGCTVVCMKAHTHGSHIQVRRQPGTQTQLFAQLKVFPELSKPEPALNGRQTRTPTSDTRNPKRKKIHQSVIKHSGSRTPRSCKRDRRSKSHRSGVHRYENISVNSLLHIRRRQTNSKWRGLVVPHRVL